MYYHMHTSNNKTLVGLKPCPSLFAWMRQARYREVTLLGVNSQGTVLHWVHSQRQLVVGVTLIVFEDCVYPKII